jgi:hypothetical protein
MHHPLVRLTRNVLPVAAAACCACCLLRALEQLLTDKQLSPSDSQQGWDELQRMRGVMSQAQEQQHALQQMYEQQQQQQQPQQEHSRLRQRHSPPQQRQQQQHRQAPQVRGRGRRGVPLQQQQQQQLQPQQKSSWLSQQHSTLCVSSQPLDVEQQQQQQLGSCDELPGDALDAFMVETQMVSGNNTNYVCAAVQSIICVLSAAAVRLPYCLPVAVCMLCSCGRYVILDISRRWPIHSLIHVLGFGHPAAARHLL